MSSKPSPTFVTPEILAKHANEPKQLLEIPHELYTALAIAKQNGETSPASLSMAALLHLEPNISKLIFILQKKQNEQEKPPMDRQISNNPHCKYSNHLGQSYND